MILEKVNASYVRRLEGSEEKVVDLKFDAVEVEDSLRASIQVVPKCGYVVIMLPSAIGAVGDRDDGKNVLFVFKSVNVPANHELGDKMYEALPGLLTNGDFNV